MTRVELDLGTFMYNRLLQLYNRLLHPPLNFFKTIRCHREPLHVLEVSHGTSSLTPPPHLAIPLTPPLPIPYLSGIPRPHKGTGTDTIVELPVPSCLVPYLSYTHPLTIWPP